jgi:serine/threonine-protein kinase
VAWEALCGRRLFGGEDAGEIFGKLLSGPIASPNEELEKARKRLAPAAVSDAVIKALARNPDDRFATARDFAIALEAAIVVAPPHRVGEWVQEFGGPELIGRQRMVTQIERYSFNFPDEFTPNPVSVGSAPSASHSDDATQRDVRPPRVAASTGATGVPRPTPARKRMLIALGLLGFGVLVFALWPQSQPPEPPPLEVRIPRPPEPRPRTLPSNQEVTPAPSAAVMTSPSASANSPAPAASASKPLRSVAPSVSPKPRTPPKKDPCNPPWRLDSRGIRHSIPGCY